MFEKRPSTPGLSVPHPLFFRLQPEARPIRDGDQHQGSHNSARVRGQQPQAKGVAQQSSRGQECSREQGKNPHADQTEGGEEKRRPAPEQTIQKDHFNHEKKGDADKDDLKNF